MITTNDNFTSFPFGGWNVQQKIRIIMDFKSINIIYRKYIFISLHI